MEIFDKILGVCWGGSFIYDAVNFKKNRREWNDAVNFSEPAEKIKAIKNKTILAGIKVSSSFSYFLSWTHQVKWISLGRFMPVVGAFALAGRALLLLSESRDSFNKIQSSHEQTEKISATFEFFANILSVASYISTLALFAVTSAVISSASNWLLVLSFVSLILKYGYNSFVEKQRVSQQAQPVPSLT
jgi:hypothetical protein